MPQSGRRVGGSRRPSRRPRAPPGARVMHYLVSMPEPQGHLFHVRMTVERPGDSAVLTMPVWTPGSYLVREFARHVEGLVATDERGATCRCERLDKHRFRVACRGAERIVVSYRV